MKKFLPALLLSLMPFVVKANVLDDIADYIATSSEIVYDTIYSNDGPIPEKENLFDDVGNAIDSAFTITDAKKVLESNADKKDYQAILDSQVKLKISSFAGKPVYNEFKKEFILNEAKHLYGESRLALQSEIHSEVTRMKDEAALKAANLDFYADRADYSKVDAGSYLLKKAILDAHAYVEQVAFIYDEKEEIYDKWKKIKTARDEVKQKGMPDPSSQEYKKLKSVMDEVADFLGEDTVVVTEENLTKLYVLIDDLDNVSTKFVSSLSKTSDNDVFHAAGNKLFDAKKEGKTDKEAQRLAILVVLDSNDFWNNGSNGHSFPQYLHEMSFGEDSVSFDKILAALGDIGLTMEDLFEAESFMAHMCLWDSDPRTSSHQTCKAYRKKLEKEYCQDFKKKYGTCKRAKAIVDCDLNCGLKLNNPKSILAKESVYIAPKGIKYWDIGGKTVEVKVTADDEKITYEFELDTNQVRLAPDNDTKKVYVRPTFGPYYKSYWDKDKKEWVDEYYPNYDFRLLLAEEESYERGSSWVDEDTGERYEFKDRAHLIGDRRVACKIAPLAFNKPIKSGSYFYCCEELRMGEND